MRACALLLCLLQLCFCAEGQQYYFQNFQADDGLLHNTVNRIIQDRNGFMWIGTRGGLNRFDGHSFKNFLIPQKRSGINFINALCEDKKGAIWVGTLGGLFKYEPSTESIEELKLMPVPAIHDLKIDLNNNLWLISAGKLYKYNQNSKIIVSTEITASAFGFDDQNVMWVGTNMGELRTFTADGKLLKISLDAYGNLPSITRIVAAGNNILIGTTKGAFSYDTTTRKITVLLSENPDRTEIYVRDIKVTSDQKYWFATESGIYVYDQVNFSVVNIKKRAGDPYSITDNAVYTLCQDNREGIWAGTFFGGLNYLSKENGQFEKYFPLNTGNSISGNAIREICEDNDRNLWIGTEDAGINKMEVTTGKFYHFGTGTAPTNLSYPNIHGLLASGNKLFAGPFLRGLEILDIKSGKVIERYPVIQTVDNKTNTFVMSIFKASDGRILIGTTGAGLFYYHAQHKKLVRVPDVPSNSFIFAIAEDHNGTIWTGSLHSGAFFFNPRTGARGNIKFNKQGDIPNNGNIIQGIYEDSKQALWFATDGSGLIRLDEDRKRFKRFTTKSGFPTDNIFRILEDDDKNLWISSLKGLICLDLDTEKFHIYSKSNGLLTDQFNYNSAFKAQDGKMYFGSVKGMIAFRPDALKIKTPAPPIYITAFEVSDSKPFARPANSQPGISASFPDSVNLAYHQSTFDIEFAALDYSASDAIRYKYRMEGLNEDWTYLHTNRKAYFTDLSPGEYKFVVQAESNIGLWKTPQRVIFIKIHPPFWKSTIAYILYITFFFAACYLIIQTYHRTLNKRNQRKLKLFELEKEKEVYYAKIEFFTNIAHEIQTPLTLIKGPIDWALDKVDDASVVRRNLKLVKKNISRLLMLTSQLLDFRKTEIDQFGLNFVSTDINQMLKDQLVVFSPSITEKRLDIGVDMPKKTIKAYVDKDAFLKILGNLISNAIKYSEKTIVITLFLPENNPDSFKLRIENDGIVIPEHYGHKIFEPFFRVRNDDNAKGTGIGLSLAKSLTELHQGTLLLISNQEMNIFELTLPIHQKIEFELKRLKTENK